MVYILLKIGINKIMIMLVRDIMLRELRNELNSLQSTKRIVKKYCINTDDLKRISMLNVKITIIKSLI